MPTDRFDHLTERLRHLGGQRVWSLMVSLFGDLTLEKEHSIDGPTLSAVMESLHIKPEATRVALHRLRNDGWIISEKTGRISHHRLSNKGRAESLAASPRIYAAPDMRPTNWQMILMPDSTDLPGFTPVTARLWIGAADQPTPAGALCLRGEAVPEWLRQNIEPATLREGYGALLDTLQTLESTLPDPEKLIDQERAVLRCLIVHNWRRLVLKHPSLPASLYSPDWPGHACHQLVFDLLTLIPRPTLEEPAA
ncbi:MAG: PaaX family transcriptional regulator C-terminal domain-containing protein [Pseudomonadota bacterium]